MDRTYVRRRAVAPLVALGVTVAFAGPVSRALGADSGSMRPVARQSYVVEPGDTIWAIASQVAGGRDPRVIVEQIEAINGVHGGSLQPGMVLQVPSQR